MAREPTAVLGQRGEALAWEYLGAQGYRLQQVNFRSAHSELDGVAYDGPVLCFIEVRCRRSTALGHPLETINRRKQARIVRAAGAYLEAHPASGPMRYDVVGIVLGDGSAPPDITLIRGAFVPTRA